MISNDEVVGSVEPIVSKVSDSFNGKCEITSDNQVKFTPKRSFEGWGRCSYTVCVDDVCDEARIKIKVFPETLIDRPAPIPAAATVEVTAKADKVSTGAGEPISIDVTKNDSTTSTQPLTVTEGSIASNGNCEVTDDNQIMYTPDAGFSGQDRCSYEVCVDNVCDIGQIGIKVFPDHPETNSPTKKPTMMPIEVLSAQVEVFAMDDQAATATETIVIDVTANDISTGDLPLTVTDAQDARHGQCEVTESNKVRYIPDGDFAGWDKCKYMVCLGDVCDKGLIEIKVLSTPIYDVYEMPKPAVETMDLVTAEVEIEKVYADDDDVETSVNQPIEVDVTHNDFVRGMDPLIVKFTGNAANGECEIIDGIQVKYTPSRDFVGQDQCDYTVCLQNLQTNCDTGVITINVASSKPMKQTSSEITDEDIRSNNGSVSPSAAKNCIHSKSRSNLGGRKLRGRKLGANSGTFQSCVGTSLVTAITTNNKEDTTTETVTYTSTYHLKRPRSAVPQSSFSDLSILRMGSTASMNAVENAYTETVISLPVNADATIMPGFPDQNFGTTSTLLINSVSSSGGRFDSVLRFQTSSVVASVCDGGILNAKLFLYSLAASTHGGTFATTSKKSWTETNVTWNSSPKGDGIVLARLGAVEKNKWYEVDVSAAINIGEPLGIRITSDDETSSRAQYASKNHSSEALSPVLKITCLNFDGVTEGNE